MTGLPAALAPWRAELELFPRELALSLGAWIPRLAAAVGPLADTDGADGEPDGFNGLARTGTYERLLHSEWLLADELPDEFLRRAVSGEHAFLALARVQPAGSRRCVVVFDAGPDQLGSPRLAHLALLIVLHRRARAAGAELVWGCAHTPGEPRDQVTPASVLGLMTARTATSAAAADLRTWSARAGRAGDDLWLIGGASVERAAAELGASRARVDDVLALDREAIAVTLTRRGSAPTAVALRLPPRDQAIRLLRDPFAATAAAVARLDMQVSGALRFNPRGDRLIARTGDDRAIGWHVPTSPRGTAGRPRIVRPNPGEVVVAVHDLSARRAIWAALAGSVLYLREGASTRMFDHEGRPAEFAAPRDPHCLWDLRETRTSGRRAHALLTDGGVMYLLVPHLSGRILGDVAAVFSDVLALGRASASDPLVMWQRVGDEVQGQHLRHDGPVETAWRAPASEPRVVTSTPRNIRTHAQLGLAAVRVAPDRWTIPGHGDIELSPEAEVVGVARDGSEVLVVIDPERQVISLRSAVSERVLHRSTSAIRAACCSDDGILLAFLDEAGSIRVLSIVTGSVRALIDTRRHP